MPHICCKLVASLPQTYQCARSVLKVCSSVLLAALFWAHNAKVSKSAPQSVPETFFPVQCARSAGGSTLKLLRILCARTEQCMATGALLTCGADCVPEQCATTGYSAANCVQDEYVWKNSRTLCMPQQCAASLQQCARKVICIRKMCLRQTCHNCGPQVCGIYVPET